MVIKGRRFQVRREQPRGRRSEPEETKRLPSLAVSPTPATSSSRRFPSTAPARRHAIPPPFSGARGVSLPAQLTGSRRRRRPSERAADREGELPAPLFPRRHPPPPRASQRSPGQAPPFFAPYILHFLHVSALPLTPRSLPPASTLLRRPATFTRPPLPALPLRLPR